MNQQLLKSISLVSLAATVVPSLMSFAGILGLNAVNVTTLVGTVVWFVVTPLWMGRESSVDDKEVQI